MGGTLSSITPLSLFVALFLCASISPWALHQNLRQNADSRGVRCSGREGQTLRIRQTAEQDRLGLVKGTTCRDDFCELGIRNAGF